MTAIHILNEIGDERQRQEKLRREGKFLWTCAEPHKDNSQKLAVLAEEFGEIAKEVTEQIIELDKYRKEMLNHPKHRKLARIAALRKELIQVAAVCTAWVEGLDVEEAAIREMVGE